MPPLTSLITIAPVPAKTRQKVPKNSPAIFLGIRGAFANAGRGAGRGGKRFGKNMAKGRPIRAGKELGKGMGSFGKNMGKGVARTTKRVFKP